MPTVPSTCVPVDTLGVPIDDTDFLASDAAIAGPTPDPDTDDLILVPADDGRAVNEDSIEHAPPHTAAKPRIELSSLNLHSPSSIVGTPFDLSPRFEYPFPNPCAPPVVQDVTVEAVPPSISMLTSPLSVMSPILNFMPGSLPLSMPSFNQSFASKPKAESRFSPTHPKLHARDPPVPPSLVKKRKLRNNAADVVSPPSPDASQVRGRGGSLSIVADKLERLSVERRFIDAEKARSSDKARAHSVDVNPKRNSLALCDNYHLGLDRATATDKAKALLPLSSSSPSLAEVFHLHGTRPYSPAPLSTNSDHQ
ncbi:hypothetical protein C8Q80DRAFT_619996 [Daedaleopsis nitida]|nr:hypothetical protein C8Q80DRAFT_619996 [Daedaleopsis nitida]